MSGEEGRVFRQDDDASNGNNNTNPWRSGYGEDVAPGARKPSDNQQTEHTNGNPSRGSGYGDNIAPGARKPPEQQPEYSNGAPGSSDDKLRNEWMEEAKRKQQQEQGHPPTTDGYSNTRNRPVTYDQAKVDAIIENSLHLKTRANTIFAEGAFTGGLVKGLTHLIDQRMHSISPENRGAGWQFWEKHMSPMAQQTELVNNHLYKTTLKIATLEPQITATANLIQPAEKYLIEQNAKLNSHGTADVLKAQKQTFIDLAATKDVAKVQQMVDSGALTKRQGDLLRAMFNNPDPAKVSGVYDKFLERMDNKIATAQGYEGRIALMHKIQAEQATLSGINSVKARTTTAEKMLIDQTKLIDDTLRAGHLTKPEAELFHNYVDGLDKHGKLTSEKAALQKELTSAEARLGAAEARILSRSGLLDTVTKGAGKGLFIAGGLMMTDHALDSAASKLFGYDTKMTNGLSFGLRAPVLAGILTSNLSSRWKAGGAIVTTGLGWAADKAFGETAISGGNSFLSKSLRTSGVETVLTTGTMLAPIKDLRIKAGLTAAMWTGSKLYNGLFTENDPATIRADMRDMLQRDQLSQAEATFKGSVNLTKELAIENPAAAVRELDRWKENQGQIHDVEFNRGYAALSQGIGEMLMERGSRLNPKTLDPRDFILSDYKLDLTGEATHYMRQSANKLMRNVQYAEQHLGETVDGITLDQDFIDRTKKSVEYVESKLNDIYGKHDIEGAFQEIKSKYRLNLDDMNHSKAELESKISKASNSPDNQYVAKLNRNMALLCLGIAEYKRNPGDNKAKDASGAEILLRRAAQALAESERRDPNAPDNKQLRIIVQRVAKDMDSLIQDQYNDPIANPHQVQR